MRYAHRQKKEKQEMVCAAVSVFLPEEKEERRMNQKAEKRTYTLKNGVTLPCVAFGTYKAPGDSPAAVRAALEAGYRYFDTASFYENEQTIGEAIRESGIPREELFLASKLWKDEMGYTEAKDAFERSLERLGTDYLDLYMIHWPLPSADTRDWKELDRETWRAMEDLYLEGRIRAIGLSNFLPHHIENLLASCRVEPMTDQLEFHPGYTQEAAVSYCHEKGIIVQAWSPLGRRRVFEDPEIQEIAARYGVSVARLCLRFALQCNVIPLPKASSPDRMKENMDLFSFTIEDEDMYRLRTLPQIGWSGEHPDREWV